MSIVTEHQEAWWGTQPCRECNPLGLPARPLNIRRPRCPNPECGGSGWTVWASLASEPCTEIIPGLWTGGHEYIDPESHELVTFSPDLRFQTVVSAYNRPDCAPAEGTEHIVVTFPDSRLTPEVKQQAVQAAQQVVDRLSGDKTVLVRCQAGLNRSNFIAGLAMVGMGFEGADAVQLIRTRRSPWALCNQEYADFVSGLSAGALTLPSPDQAS